jgi:hypothetical protein
VPAPIPPPVQEPVPAPSAPAPPQTPAAPAPAPAPAPTLPAPNAPDTTPGVEPPPILDPALQQYQPAPLPPLPYSSAPQIESVTLFPDMVGPEAPLPTITDSRKWQFVFFGSTRATYDSNIFIQPTNEQEDFIFTIAPGFAFGWGDFKGEMLNIGSFRDRYERDLSETQIETSYIYLSYTPSYTIFADHSNENTFDHDITLRGQWVLQRLTLGAHFNFLTLNVPDVDVGDRQEQRRFSGAITSKYDFSEKTSIELNLYNFIRDYERSTDTTEWRAQTWVNYQLLPKTNIGVGFAAGAVEPSAGPSQTYEQGLLRIRYKATEKLLFAATGGVEFRQVDAESDRTNGVFSLSLSWRPFDGTYVYLQGYRRTQTSASRGQNYTSTGADLRFRQRLFQRFYVGLAAGYQSADYDALENQTAGARSDDLFYIRPTVGLDITTFLSAEFGMEFRTNDSTNERRSFDDTLVFLQLNYLF